MSSNEQDAVFATTPFPCPSSRIEAPVHIDEPNWSLTSRNDIQRKRWEESSSRQVVNAPTKYFLLLKYCYITLAIWSRGSSPRSSNSKFVKPRERNLTGSCSFPHPDTKRKLTSNPATTGIHVSVGPCSLQAPSSHSFRAVVGSHSFFLPMDIMLHPSIVPHLLPSFHIKGLCCEFLLSFLLLFRFSFFVRSSERA
jgi:hypothetical protein